MMWRRSCTPSVTARRRRPFAVWRPIDEIRGLKERGKISPTVCGRLSDNRLDEPCGDGSEAIDHELHSHGGEEQAENPCGDIESGIAEHFVNPTTREQHRPGSGGKNQDYNSEPDCVCAALRLASVKNDRGD